MNQVRTCVRAPESRVPWHWHIAVTPMTVGSRAHSFCREADQRSGRALGEEVDLFFSTFVNDLCGPVLPEPMSVLAGGNPIRLARTNLTNLTNLTRSPSRLLPGVASGMCQTQRTKLSSAGGYGAHAPAWGFMTCRKLSAHTPGTASGASPASGPEAALYRFAHAAKIGVSKNTISGYVWRQGWSRQTPASTMAERLDALHARMDEILAEWKTRTEAGEIWIAPEPEKSRMKAIEGRANV